MQQYDILEKYFSAARNASPAMEMEKAKEIIFNKKLPATAFSSSVLQKTWVWVVTSAGIFALVAFGYFLYEIFEAGQESPIAPSGSEAIITDRIIKPNKTAGIDSAVEKKNNLPKIILDSTKADNKIENINSNDEIGEALFYIPNQWYRFRSVVGAQGEAVEISLFINSSNELIFTRNNKTEPQLADKPAIYFFGEKKNINIKRAEKGTMHITFKHGEFLFIPFIESGTVEINVRDTLLISCGRTGEIPCLQKKEAPNRLAFLPASISDGILITGLRKEILQLNDNDRKLSFSAGGVIVQVSNN